MTERSPAAVTPFSDTSSPFHVAVSDNGSKLAVEVDETTSVLNLTTDDSTLGDSSESIRISESGATPIFRPIYQSLGYYEQILCARVPIFDDLPATSDSEAVREFNRSRSLDISSSAVEHVDALRTKCCSAASETDLCVEFVEVERRHVEIASLLCSAVGPCGVSTDGGTVCGTRSSHDVEMHGDGVTERNHGDVMSGIRSDVTEIYHDDVTEENCADVTESARCEASSGDVDTEVPGLDELGPGEGQHRIGDEIESERTESPLFDDVGCSSNQVEPRRTVDLTLSEIVDVTESTERRPTLPIPDVANNRTDDDLTLTVNGHDGQEKRHEDHAKRHSGQHLTDQHPSAQPTTKIELSNGLIKRLTVCDSEIVDQIPCQPFAKDIEPFVQYAERQPFVQSAECKSFGQSAEQKQTIVVDRGSEASFVDSFPMVVNDTSGVVDHTAGVVDHTSGVVDHTSGVIDHTSGVVDHTLRIVDHSYSVVAAEIKTVTSKPCTDPEDRRQFDPVDDCTAVTGLDADVEGSSDDSRATQVPSAEAPCFDDSVPPNESLFHDDDLFEKIADAAARWMLEEAFARMVEIRRQRAAARTDPAGSGLVVDEKTPVELLLSSDSSTAAQVLLVTLQYRTGTVGNSSVSHRYCR